MIIGFDKGTAKPGSLDDALRRAPSHLYPVYSSVRDHGCAHAMIMPGNKPFGLSNEPPGPLIILVGDDYDRSRGPRGFHLPSLRPLLARCSVATVVSGLHDMPYRQVCTNAVVARQDVAIIETRQRHELEWVALLRECRPNIGLVVCSEIGAEAHA